MRLVDALWTGAPCHQRTQPVAALIMTLALRCCPFADGGSHAGSTTQAARMMMVGGVNEVLDFSTAGLIRGKWGALIFTLGPAFDRCHRAWCLNMRFYIHGCCCALLGLWLGSLWLRHARCIVGCSVHRASPSAIDGFVGVEQLHAWLVSTRLEGLPPSLAAILLSWRGEGVRGSAHPAGGCVSSAVALVGDASTRTHKCVCVIVTFTIP